MAQATFAATANSTTNGVALGAVDEDVVVYKICVGTPVSSGNVRLFNISNPVGTADTNLAAKITFPSFSTTNVNNGYYEMDFGPKGLTLTSGGCLSIDQTMNVTVVWEPIA